MELANYLIRRRNPESLLAKNVAALARAELAPLRNRFPSSDSPMPSYRVFITAGPHEPFPPLDTLPAVEALDPISAVEELLATVPQNRPMRWARVIENGQSSRIVKVPLEANDVLGVILKRDDGLLAH
jgi:hypothetical protein